jgi:peptidyl-prolyl cis-trans isomerase A (cyclophilin A)
MKKLMIILSCLIAVAGCSHQSVTRNTDPHILIETDYGNIEAVLYADNAPIAVNNFLRYIKEDRLSDARFYRAVRLSPDNQPDKEVKIEVLQGGLYDDDHPEQLPPIKHETTEQTGITHLDGTLSMARWGPGTATIEFSICIGDQPELNYKGRRNPDGWGFTAFGRVVSGMEVVRKIHRLPTKGQYLEKHFPMRKVTVMKDITKDSRSL